MENNEGLEQNEITEQEHEAWHYLISIAQRNIEFGEGVIDYWGFIEEARKIFEIKIRNKP